jgi:hypothetical protein
LEESELLVGHGVSVLVDEALDFVLDVDGIVGDGERVPAKPRLLKDVFVLGRVELLVELGDEGGVGSGRETRLFVEEG